MDLQRFSTIYVISFQSVSNQLMICKAFNVITRNKQNSHATPRKSEAIVGLSSLFAQLTMRLPACNMHSRLVPKRLSLSWPDLD